jgi:hypothetical protein
MNAKEFNKELREIVGKFDNVKESKQYMYEVETVLGVWLFSAEHSPRIKLANLHSRFNGPEYSEDKFKQLIDRYKVPNTFSKKWNHYSVDPQFMLDFIYDTLGNFEYLEHKERFDFNLFPELNGKCVQMNDRFESVHLWGEQLAIKNKGKWIPEKISREKYQNEKQKAWNQ